ncbi:MAG: maltose ABC transporter substrate-binding protein [Oscillospiraceae bacterium]|nr:maltose ABC transporter substrate-binding protein [Oscillospiraceae bacterium]
MKKILALVLVLALIAGFAACTNDTPAPAPPAPDPTDTATPAPAPVEVDPDAEEITLVVWESLDGPDEFIRQAGAAFNAIHPHITVEFVNVELGDAATQIALDGPGGVGPDLFVAGHDRMGDLVYGQHVAPLDASYLSNILAGSLMAVTFNDQVYGFPISAETYGLFYNRALVDTPPTTWEGVVEFARDFNAENPGQYGFVMATGNSYYSILFTSSENNMLFGPDGTDATDSRLNSPESIAGLEFFQSLREILPVAAGDLDDGTVDDIFVAGQAAMHITGPWNIMRFRDEGLDFGVTTLPSLPGNNTPAMSFSGTRTMYLSNYSLNKEAAELFGRFVISPEMQALRYEITGALPTIAMELGGEFGEWANGILEQLAFSYPMPSIPAMGRFWDVMGDAFSAVWDGADIQETMDTANTAIVGG